MVYLFVGVSVFDPKLTGDSLGSQASDVVCDGFTAHLLYFEEIHAVNFFACPIHCDALDVIHQLLFCCRVESVCIDVLKQVVC